MKRMKNMKKLLILTAGIVVLLVPALAFAVLNPPHTPDSPTPVNCDSCHMTFSDEASNPIWNQPPANMDDLPTARICWQVGCHDSGGAYAKVHSSISMGSTTYGNWSETCTVCHDPHVQKQGDNNPATMLSGFNLVGEVTNIAGNTLTLSVNLPDIGTPGVDNDYTGWTIIPNARYRTINYKIASNTANTVTLTTTPMAPRIVLNNPAYQYVIFKGSFIKNVVNTPTGPKSVMFFKREGEYSYAHNDGLAPGGNDSTPDGICQVCHTQTTRMTFDGTGVTDGHPTDDCTDCHQHDEGLKGQCGSCHGSPPTEAVANASSSDGRSGLIDLDINNNPQASGSTIVGAHDAHVNTHGLSCVNCHNNGMLSGAGAGDDRINIQFTAGGQILTAGYQGQAAVNSGPFGPYDGGGTTAITTGSPQRCTNLYCHSKGQADNGGPLTGADYATVNWNPPSAVNCGDCHLNPPVTASHDEHLGSAVTMQCGDCHNGAGDGSTVPTTNHVNYSIDVLHSYTAAGTPGNGYGTCSVASCHGSGTPQWGTDFSGIGDLCARCHGTDGVNAAPGPDTAGDTAATDPQVGAHQAHLQSQSNISADIACTECHTVPSSVEDAGHIQDGTPGVAEVPLAGTLATANSASPSYSAGSCSNTYCHGNAMPKGSTNGAAMTPSWTNTSYLSGTHSADCGQCHGAPPLDIGAHNAGMGLDACEGCHGNMTYSAGTVTFADPSLHINGILEPPTGCTGCHGQSGSSGAPLIASDEVSPPTGGAGVGSHPMHVITQNITDCNVCHSGHNMPTLDDNIHIGFTGQAAGGSYDGYPLNAPYAFTGDIINPGTSAGDGQCSNISCHSSGQAADGTASPLTYGTPTWGGSLDCGSCHKNMDTDGTAPGGHVIHAQTQSIACATCHNGYTETTTNPATHNNTNINLTFSGLASGASYSQGTTHALGNGYGNCGTLYCHSTGQSATGGATPTYASPVWGGAALNCGSCHKNMDTDNTAPGSHVMHAQTSGIACATCHNGYTETTTASGTHVNQWINLSFSGAAAGTTYSQGAIHAAGNNYGTCSASACHSSGQAADGSASPLTYGTPTWGGTLDCGSCHKNMDTDGTATGSHVTHAQDFNFACATCHNGYTETSTGATHNNTEINLTFSGLAAGTTYSQGSPHALGNGYGSCSTSDCHGASSPTWGSGSASDCSLCHGMARSAAARDLSGNTDPAVMPLGAHAAHLNAPGGFANAVSCADCHTDPDATVGTYVQKVNTAGHIDASAGAEVALSGGRATGNGLYPSPTYSQPTCAVWCHGVGLNTYPGAPTWNDDTYLPATAAKDVSNCSKCHGAPPGAAANYDHVTNGLTIASDCSGCHGHNGFDPTHIDGNLDAAGGGCNGCHGYDPAADGGIYIGDGYSGKDTDLTPNNEGKGAHNKHIIHIKNVKGVTLDAASDTFGTGAAGTVCGTCHTNTVANHTMGGDPTGRLINFGDGSTEYQFGPSAPVYNGTPGTSSTVDFKSCSNISCHFRETPGWQDPATAGE